MSLSTHPDDRVVEVIKTSPSSTEDEIEKGRPSDKFALFVSPECFTPSKRLGLTKGVFSWTATNELNELVACLKDEGFIYVETIKTDVNDKNWFELRFGKPNSDPSSDGSIYFNKNRPCKKYVKLFRS